MQSLIKAIIIKLVIWAVVLSAAIICTLLYSHNMNVKYDNWRAEQQEVESYDYRLLYHQ